MSSFVFDNAYYKDLMAGKGLLASDNALVLDNRTRPQVVAFSEQPAAFFAAFGRSMTKLGGLGVLTNMEGEIRSASDCGCVNWCGVPWFRTLLKAFLSWENYDGSFLPSWGWILETQRTLAVCNALSVQKGELPSPVAMAMKVKLSKRILRHVGFWNHMSLATLLLHVQWRQQQTTLLHMVFMDEIIVAYRGHAMVFCSEANLVNKA